jgi:hypothetical protein
MNGDIEQREGDGLLWLDRDAGVVVEHILISIAARFDSALRHPKEISVSIRSLKSQYI